MKYKVDINGNNFFYGLNKNEFEVGEKVEFTVPFVTDGNMIVTSDDVKLNRTDTTSYDYGYYFIMPENDVKIDVGFQQTMMNPGYFGKTPEVTMGMMAGFMTTMFDYQNQMNNTVILTDGTVEVECPACKYKANSSMKFCPNCGNKLL